MTSIMQEFTRVYDPSNLEWLDRHMAIYIALHFPIYLLPCEDTGKCVSYVKDIPYYL